jgi:hypothetical protein
MVIVLQPNPACGSGIACRADLDWIALTCAGSPLTDPTTFPLG